MDAPRKNVMTARWSVAGVFAREDSSHKPRGLKAVALGECVPIVPAKRLSTLPPFQWISSWAFARRVRHANPRTHGGRSQSTRIEVGLSQVVMKFLVKAKLRGIRLHGLYRINRA